MPTRSEIEAALDAGHLEACVNSSKQRWWKLRRNGMTKTWKTRPQEFRIPVKCGLRTCGVIDHNNLNDSSLFRIV